LCALQVPIVGIHPATPANCLVVLTADGALRLLHSDTFEGRVAVKAGALAAAVDLPARGPPRLAVVTRAGKRAVKCAAYELLPAGGQAPGSRTLWEVELPDVRAAQCVHGVAWAGASVVCAAGGRYLLAAGGGGGGGGWRELLAVPEEAAAAQAPAAQALPRLGRALLTAGAVAVVVDAGGEPVGNPLSLEGLPPVRALGAGAGFVVAACEDGMHVFDPGTGARAQSLPYGADASPAPGQPIFAASGGGPAAGCVVVAGRHKVWALVPLPPVRQARELLQRRDYAAAAELAGEAAGRGEAWAEEAYAQAALLLVSGALCSACWPLFCMRMS
jgi:hypothetical protein